MHRFWIYAFVLLTLPLCAGTTQYATDLRTDSGTNAWLGFVNPTDAAMTVIITGFTETGAPIGAKEVILPAYGSYEGAAASFFGNTIAWATVTSDGVPVGYTRYAGSGNTWISAAPLSRTSGDVLWVSQLNNSLEGFTPTTVLVNTTGNQGSATAEPNVLASSDKVGSHVFNEDDGTVTLEDFGAPYSQGELDYAAAFAKPLDLTWDTITATDIHITGMQHLADGDARAAYHLPRTPARRMVLGLQQPLREGMWNKLVLVNTNQSPLRVEITPHYSWYGTPPYDFTYQTEPDTLILDPGERRVINVDEHTQQSIPAVADWYEVQAFDSGLLGFQLFGTEAGNAVGAVETEHQPGSKRVLPYVVTSSDLLTDITLINTSEAKSRGRLMGYDSNGNLRANVPVPDLRAYEQRTFTTEEVFGDNASAVTWVTVLNSTGHLATQSVTYRRDYSAMSGLAGVATIAHTDESLFSASVEQFDITDFRGQGWRETHFTDAGEMVFVQSWESANGDAVKPGEFWVENAFDAEGGYFYLGYEPFHSQNWAARSFGITERVALVSPYIEIPQHGDWFLNYRMRFHNPEDAKDESRYGMMWREEGSDNWFWFGLSGRHLLNPDGAIGDCWVDIQWRNLDITVTQWIEMEMQLPAELAGKRIQVAYYYDHQPESASDTAPWMFIDSVNIQPTPLDHSLYYADWGEGWLTPEDLSRIDDNFPLPGPATKSLFSH